MSTCRWVTIFILTILYGCSGHNVKERYFEADRSAYYPLAVVSASSIPQVTGQAVKQYDSPISEHEPIVCAAGILSPVPVLLGPMFCSALIDSAVEETRRQELGQELQVTLDPGFQQLQPKMKSAIEQITLHEQAIDYLKKWNADAHEVNSSDSSDDTLDYYQSLQKQGFRMALEMTLLSVDLTGQRVLSEKLTPGFCLTILVQGRAINTENSQTVAIERVKGQRCYSMEEWMQDGVLEKAVSTLSSSLTQYVLNEILFIYHKEDLKNKSDIVILPVKPKVLIVDKKYGDKKSTSIEWTPKRQKDFTTNTMSFTDVSTKPNFEWSVFDGRGITDVRYEFLIFKGAPRIKSIRAGYNPFDDNVYPRFKFIYPAKLIYTRDNLISASHKPDITLEPCSWYLWTVRASFQLYGSPRLTNWSMFWEKPFPIRTPASEADPACWEQEVDWGAL